MKTARRKFKDDRETSTNSTNFHNLNKQRWLDRTRLVLFVESRPHFPQFGQSCFDIIKISTRTRSPVNLRISRWPAIYGVFDKIATRAATSTTFSTTSCMCVCVYFKHTLRAFPRERAVPCKPSKRPFNQDWRAFTYCPVVDISARSITTPSTNRDEKVPEKERYNRTILSLDRRSESGGFANPLVKRKARLSIFLIFFALKCVKSPGDDTRDKKV